MVQPPDGELSSACPYVNYNDHRCGGRLSIARLEEAFPHLLQRIPRLPGLSPVAT